MKAVLRVIYSYNNRANSQKDASVKDYWNVVKGTLLDAAGEQHKLWREWKQGNRSKKYLAVKKKDRRVAY